jgi:TonB family protein
VRSLREMMVAGKAWPASGLPAHAVALPHRGRAWVRIGESTVVAETVEPGPALKAPLLGGLDSSGLLSNAFSFGAHAVVLLLVFAVPPSAAALSLDSFNLDSRTVRYSIRPREAPDQERVPAWLARTVRPDRPAGGPSTRGTPGRVGNPAARPLRGRLAVRGSSPELRPAREWARLAARDFGILGIMNRRRGGPFAHIFGGDSALGSDALDAMGGLIANTVGEDDGTGGLGPIGTGRNGGGDAHEIIPGTGLRIPNGRGPGGWGPWAAPREGLRDHRTRAPAPRPTITVKGSLDKELIRREIKRHINEIRYCYSKELQAKPDLRGRVVVSFTIAASGRVVSSQVQQTTLGDSEVERCITQAFFRWSFPKPPDQGMVLVSYPFVFHATE